MSLPIAAKLRAVIVAVVAVEVDKAYRLVCRYGPQRDSDERRVTAGLSVSMLPAQDLDAAFDGGLRCRYEVSNWPFRKHRRVLNTSCRQGDDRKRPAAAGLCSTGRQDPPPLELHWSSSGPADVGPQVSPTPHLSHEPPLLMLSVAAAE